MTTDSTIAAPADARVKRLVERLGSWRNHPGVRSGKQLSLGERAADRMRNSMGSWAFVFGALVFLALWMGFNGNSGFDKYPFILLNLVLSCLAAMQGAILLIAAKRSDQISAELAEHDYNTDVEAKAIIESLAESFAAMAAQHEDLHRQVAAMRELLSTQQVGPGTPAS
jgi:uncharacterized membrane protein